MGWTTDELLERAKLYAFFPTSTGGPALTDPEILRLGSDDIDGYVFPRIIAAQGEWRVHSQDTALAADQSGYRLPKRSFADRVRDVLLVRSDGSVRSLVLYQPSELGERFDAKEAGSPEGFYVENAKLRLVPYPSSVGESLRIKYWMRPGQLVETSACARITSLGSLVGDNRVLVFANVPSTWTTSSTVDIVRATGGFDTTHIDLTVAAITTGASGTISIATSALDTAEIEVGDYVCLAGESCVPQIPASLHMWLAQRMAAQILNVQDEAAAFQRAQAKADETEARVIEVIEPRISGEPAVPVPTFSALFAIRS